jgi:hypothetical protein
MKLIIATPFYESRGFAPYIISLISSIQLLERSKIEFDYWGLSGDSYIDRARNTICNRFLDTDATHLLFIDSDMSWNIEGFANMIKSPYEVTGAAYPTKNNWENYGVAIETLENGVAKVDEKTGLIKAGIVPGGFLMITRSCLEKFRDNYPGLYYYDSCADVEKPKQKHTIFFECTTEGHVRFGEDVTFCHRWSAIGGEIWLEPRISFGHYGIKGWNGNYHEFLLNQPQPKS